MRGLWINIVSICSWLTAVSPEWTITTRERSTPPSAKTLTFTGRDSIEVRTGSSGVTYFTLNGTSLGTLGKSGVPETWLFAPPHPPEKTQRR